MLWLMLPAPGIDVSPRARAAWMSCRASSVLVQPRSSRCRRSQTASSDDIGRNGNGRQFGRDTPCPPLFPIVCRRRVAAIQGPIPVGRWHFGPVRADPTAHRPNRNGDARVSGVVEGCLVVAGGWVGYGLRSGRGGDLRGGGVRGGGGGGLEGGGDQAVGPVPVG